jgi:hypothetical protein
MQFQHGTKLTQTVDLLLNSQSAASGANNFVAYTQIVAANSYNLLDIVVATSTGIPYCAVVTNLTVSAGSVVPTPFIAAFVNKGTLFPTTRFQCVVPVCCGPGDTLQVTIYLSTTAVTVTTSVFGYTSSSTPQLRSDGRCIPVGALGGVLSTGTVVGTGTVIPAPAAPLRVLMKDIFITGGATTTGVSNGNLNFIVNGTTCGGPGMGGGTGVGSPNSYNDASGILCDVATAVTFFTGTVSQQGVTVTVMYDMVA